MPPAMKLFTGCERNAMPPKRDAISPGKEERYATEYKERFAMKKPRSAAGLESFFVV